VAVLAVTGGAGSAIAAKPATATIPIVFVMGGDPVKAGLVASLNRPGGNITGVTMLTVDLAEKRLGLLHELVPWATTVAVIVNPDFREAERQVKEAEAASARLGLELVILFAKSESEFAAAFATLVARQAGALMVSPDPFFNSRRGQIVALAAEHRIPTIYEFREFAEVGGLMSYGTDLADAYRQVGVYTGRILKGAKPADLPVVQSTRFELVVNLATAKALGITIPPAILIRADEVIE
jgi:putative ABC transport system substrate-binding protein